MAEIRFLSYKKEEDMRYSPKVGTSRIAAVFFTYLTEISQNTAVYQWDTRKSFGLVDTSPLLW